MKKKFEIKLLSRKEFEYNDLCAYMVLSILLDGLMEKDKSYKIVSKALSACEKLIGFSNFPSNYEIDDIKYFEEIYGHEFVRRNPENALEIAPENAPENDSE